jgi:hypothetical protein
MSIQKVTFQLTDDVLIPSPPVPLSYGRFGDMERHLYSMIKKQTMPLVWSSLAN